MHTQFSTRGTESKQMNTIVLRTSAKLTNIYVLYFTIMLSSISKIKSKRKHPMNIHSFLGNPSNWLPVCTSDEDTISANK